jgi:hypothetical protein
MSISSRALGKIREGSETRDTTVSPEHPPLIIKISDDIVRSSWKHEKMWIAISTIRSCRWYIL